MTPLLTQLEPRSAMVVINVGWSWVGVATPLNCTARPVYPYMRAPFTYLQKDNSK